MKLTPEQIRQFEEEGYFFLPGCFSDEEVAVLRDEAEEIYRSGRPEVWREKTGAPRTAFAAHTYNEAFRLLGTHPRLVEPLEQVFGEGVYTHQFKINAKAAFEGDVWQWHQDYGTWARDDGMPEPRAMNIAVFMDEVMAINGPLMLIPKSHKHGTLAAEHDVDYDVLSSVDARQGNRHQAGAGRRHRCADREARLGADVPRQSGARLGTQHHALSAPHRLPDALRGLELYPHADTAGVDCPSRLHADRARRGRRAAELRPQLLQESGRLFYLNQGERSERSVGMVKEQIDIGVFTRLPPGGRTEQVEMLNAEPIQLGFVSLELGNNSAVSH